MEGPSVKVIAETLGIVQNQKILAVRGNTRQIKKESLIGETIRDVYSSGKRLIIKTDTLALVIHFLMYGSYTLKTKKKTVPPRLSLILDKTEVNFYNCSIKLINHQHLTEYSVIDILHPEFNKNSALSTVKQYDGEISDILLDQTVFPGVGNIIKNEALFRAGIHPENRASNIPSERVLALIENVIDFSRAFYTLRKEKKRLKPILLVYRARQCCHCKGRIIMKKTGNRNRISFFCPKCQRIFQP